MARSKAWNSSRAILGDVHDSFTSFNDGSRDKSACEVARANVAHFRVGVQIIGLELEFGRLAENVKKGAATLGPVKLSQ